MSRTFGADLRKLLRLPLFSGPFARTRVGKMGRVVGLAKAFFLAGQVTGGSECGSSDDLQASKLDSFGV